MILCGSEITEAGGSIEGWQFKDAHPLKNIICRSTIIFILENFHHTKKA